MLHPCKAKNIRRKNIFRATAGWRRPDVGGSNLELRTQHGYQDGGGGRVKERGEEVDDGGGGRGGMHLQLLHLTQPSHRRPEINPAYFPCFTEMFGTKKFSNTWFNSNMNNFGKESRIRCRDPDIASEIELF